MCTLQRPIQIVSWQDQGALNIPASVLGLPWRRLKLLAGWLAKCTSCQQGRKPFGRAMPRTGLARDPRLRAEHFRCTAMLRDACLGAAGWCLTCVETHAMRSIDYQQAIGDLPDSCTACTLVRCTADFGQDRCWSAGLGLIRCAASPYRTADRLPADIGRNEAVEHAQRAVAAAAASVISVTTF